MDAHGDDNVASRTLDGPSRDCPGKQKSLLVQGQEQALQAAFGRPTVCKKQALINTGFSRSAGLHCGNETLIEHTNETLCENAPRYKPHPLQTFFRPSTALPSHPVHPGLHSNWRYVSVWKHDRTAKPTFAIRHPTLRQNTLHVFTQPSPWLFRQLFSENVGGVTTMQLDGAGLAYVDTVLGGKKAEASLKVYMGRGSRPFESSSSIRLPFHLLLFFTFFAIQLVCGLINHCPLSSLSCSLPTYLIPHKHPSILQDALYQANRHRGHPGILCLRSRHGRLHERRQRC